MRRSAATEAYARGFDRLPDELDATGKRRRVPVGQAIAFELVQSLAALKGREFVAARKFAEKPADKARRHSR